MSDTGLLFDLRSALAFRMATTGLLVVGGVEKFSWICEPRTPACKEESRISPGVMRRWLSGWRRWIAV
jgi:hypothetical protein